VKVAVIGAGIHGSSTAWQIAKRSHAVTIFEQFPLGHDRGSSHGDSRIVRRAYPDAFYTEIMQEGYPLWHELEVISKRKLLYECGLFYFGDSQAENVKSVIVGLEQLEINHDVLDYQTVRKVFPELVLKKHEVGAFTPEAGWVHASLAIRTLVELAQSHGAVVRQQRVDDLESLKKSFDRIVLCQGAWANQFLHLPVLVTLQTFGYLSGEQDGPVWIEDSKHNLYGFPSEPWGSGIKIGVHYKDTPFDPDAQSRNPSQGAVELIEDFAWRRLGFNQPRVTREKSCLYTNTAGEDFLLGRLDEKVFFVSACSGHGFKFGPWIGKTMADFVDEEKKPEDFPRFVLGA